MKIEPVYAPSLINPRSVYFIFRPNGDEIRVELKNGRIVHTTRPLYEYEVDFFTKISADGWTYEQ